MRRILVDTDTDDDRKLGTMTGLCYAPWFETHIGDDNQMVNQIIGHVYPNGDFEEAMVLNILNTEKVYSFSLGQIQ